MTGKMRVRNPDGGWIEIDGGAKIPTKLSELTSDAAHRTVTDAEKAAWDGKLDADKLPEAVNDALAQAKASGEFDGEPGADGITPHIGSNGNWYVGDTDTGKPGRGMDGRPGQDGYTPVKGKDYWTDAEQENILEEVSNQLSLEIADELAKRGQLKPEFANSIEECTDTNKLYVLPDGYIYAYVLTERPAYTNVISSAFPSTEETEVAAFAAQGNKPYIVGYNRDTSSGKIMPNEYYSTTGLIPMKKGDVIYVKNISPRVNFGSGSVLFFGAQKDLSQIFLAKTIWEANFPNHLSNGVYVFDIDDESLVGITDMHFILCTDGIDENTIITINQPITDEVIKEYAWMNTGRSFIPADYEDRILALEEIADEIEETVEEIAKKHANAFDYTAYGLPILYLTGDTAGMTKDDKVTLDYVYGERSGTCTVKWQGSSSLTYPKKNYTVTFDNAFEAYPGWGLQKKYCMKANFMEFSHSRNLCCAKLWGKIVRSRANADAQLAAAPNGGAVDGFPIVIVINDMYQGIYTFNIPKDAWMFGMGSGSKEAILCADVYSSASRATLFENDALCDGTDFELEYVTDENNSAWVAESVNRLINAVLASDGTDIDTTIAQYIDINSAIDYLIFVPLVHGADMLVKNYILATYDGVKWFFSAYDMDSTFGLTWHAGYYGDKNGKAFNPASGTPDEEYPGWGSMSTHRLFKLLIDNKMPEIRARYNELRAGVMSEASVAHEFNEFEASIPKPYFDEEPKLWPTIPATSANNVNQIVMHYMLRAKMVDDDVH